MKRSAATNYHGLLGTRKGIIIDSFAFCFRCSKRIAHLDTVSVIWEFIPGQ